MKIAVITPYFKESTEVLLQCHQSVLAQQVQADHYMVSDGFPNPKVDKWKVEHIKLSRPHSDNGNTPRGIGSLLAQNEGYDFVSYLDADNWFHPNHLSSLLALYEKTKSCVLSSFRTFHTLDGLDMKITETQEDQLEHIDTSCYLLHKDAFELLPLWTQMHKRLSPICDRIFFAAIKHRRLPIRSTGQPTVAFRSQYASHYQHARLDIPENAKTSSEFSDTLNFLKSVSGVADCVKNIGFWPLPYLLK